MIVCVLTQPQASSSALCRSPATTKRRGVAVRPCVYISEQHRTASAQPIEFNGHESYTTPTEVSTQLRSKYDTHEIPLQTCITWLSPANGSCPTRTSIGWIGSSRKVCSASQAVSSAVVRTGPDPGISRSGKSSANTQQGTCPSQRMCNLDPDSDSHDANDS
jgi:hypothetical protein